VNAFVQALIDCSAPNGGTRLRIGSRMPRATIAKRIPWLRCDAKWTLRRAAKRARGAR
jgi:hypothetical protein